MKKILSLILLGALCIMLLSSCENVKQDSKDIAEIVVKDYGTIVVQLDRKSAPITVANFEKLASSGFYDGLTFHRVMANFMIQGGAPNGNGTGGYVDENGNRITIKGEFLQNGVNNPISHDRGVISMARSKSYDSASSQFFIVVGTNVQYLDGNYAAFGQVIEGMDVVDKIVENTASSLSSGLVADESIRAVIEKIIIK